MRPHLLLPARMSLFTSVIAGLILAGLMAAPIAAANNSRLFAFVGDCQVTGVGAGNKKTVTIEWRDWEGTLKSRHSVTSNAAGDFTGKCERYEEIEPDDTFRTKTGGVWSPLLTIPHLSANIDRVTDDVNGFGPANTDLEVHLLTHDGSFAHVNDTLYPVTTGPDGSFYAHKGGFGIKGYDWVEVYWQSPRGDLVGHRTFAEGMTIWLNRPHLSVVGDPGTDVSIGLWNGGPPNELGHTGGTLWEGDNLFYLYDDFGRRVRPRASEVITADFATDAHFDLPNISAIPSKVTDQVRVDCRHPNTAVRVDVYARDGTKFASRIGWTNSGNLFFAEFLQSPARNIVAGDKVDIYCMRDTGDVIARRYVVE